MKTALHFTGRFLVVRCFDKEGRLQWERKARNTVLNLALNDILDVYLHGATATGTWYLGLIDDSPTIDPADAMESHAGWTENTSYEGNRPAFVEAAADGQAISNSASPAVFTMTDAAVIAGAFLCGAASGSSCLLFCAAEFDEGDAIVTAGSVINVIYELQAANAAA